MPPTPQERQAFGRELKRLRNARKETIQLVVDDLRTQDPNLSVSKVSAWERGEYAPKHPSLVNMLEQRFGVEGVLHAKLNQLPSEPSQIEQLEHRVGEVEARLARLEGAGGSVSSIVGSAGKVAEQRSAEDLPEQLAAAGGNPERKKRPRKTRPSPPAEDV